MFAGNNIMEICFKLVVIDLFIVNNIQNKVKTKFYLIEIADDNVNDVKVDESLEHDVDDRSERKQNNAQDDVFNNKQDYDDSSGKRSKGSHREHGNKGKNNKHRHKINIQRIKRFHSKHGKGNMENVKDSSGKRSKGSHSEHGNKGKNNKHVNKSNKYMTKSLSNKPGEGNMKNVKVVSANYSKMEDGQLCSDSLSLITTEADCKAAAEELKLKWDASWTGNGDFPGCLHANDGRNKVYFNQSPSPNKTANNPKYAAICKMYKATKNNTLAKIDKPHLLKLKIYLDDMKVDEYKKLYGKSYEKKVTKQLKNLTQYTSKLLRKLDNDGFVVEMDEPLVLLSESQLSVGKTYIDRTDNNIEKPLDINHTDFTLGLALALQDKIKSLNDFQPSPDRLIILLTPFKKGRELEAITEENCICKKNPEHPCVGVWAHKKTDKAALLAHEIAHALGAELHDPENSNTIMEPQVQYWHTDWSQYTNDQINQQDNTCLKTTRRPPLPSEKGHKQKMILVNNRRADTSVKHKRDCIPPCSQPLH